MQISIKNYFRYFAGGPDEKAWGAFVSSVGRTLIAPGKPYPPPGHPGGRQFRWETGRVLPVLQMVAIHSGSGVVEWEDGARTVRAGEAFFLRPGEWHRYRPDPASGWREEWIELRGPMVDKWLVAGQFRDRVVTLPFPESFFKVFDDLHRLAAAPPKRAPAAPGELLGFAIILLSKATSATPSTPRHPATRIQNVVERATEALREGMSVTQTARALGISYPTLHRHFRAVCGTTPKSAATQMRHARAEALLAENKLSIKEIAADLGFHSSSHFSLAFKRRYGVSPRAWRMD